MGANRQLSGNIPPRPDIAPVLAFLHCRTPDAWLEHAARDTAELLQDHAVLELKAAQQAQKLIWKYGRDCRGRADLDAAFRKELVQKLSRLAREELRHFEKVADMLAARGRALHAVTPARYAAGLHALARRDEPAALVDALLIAAIIEARSCERFFSLSPLLESTDGSLARFYASLLRSEARHFEDYLALARKAAGTNISARLNVLLRRDSELILAPDTQLRLHSGVPGTESPAA
jgi:tRNA-(ms[2]io[6]A)-hydroxylase